MMAVSTSGVPATSPPAVRQGARERVLDAAYDLFARRGVRDVGVNELIAASGVAKATFYRHFPSKDDVVLAFLQRREEVWTIGLVAAGAAQRASSPEGQLLAIFDVFAEWFQRDDFEGCAFVKVLLEVGPEHRLGKACIACLDRIRAHLTSLAEEAGLEETEGFSRSLMIIIKGCILSILEGDEMSAERAKRMTLRLIEDHRPPAGQ
jgi:AcrR family transcriptional regulator